LIISSKFDMGYYINGQWAMGNGQFTINNTNIIN